MFPAGHEKVLVPPDTGFYTYYALLRVFTFSTVVQISAKPAIFPCDVSGGFTTTVYDTDLYRFSLHIIYLFHKI